MITSSRLVNSSEDLDQPFIHEKKYVKLYFANPTKNDRLFFHIFFMNENIDLNTSTDSGLTVFSRNCRNVQIKRKHHLCVMMVLQDYLVISWYEMD